MAFFDIFNLQEKEVIAGYRGKTIHTGTMTFMYWTVDEGAVMPEHSHVHEQVAHVLKGIFELTVVEKRIMLVEEIHVSKLKIEKTETQQVTVRKEEVTINRTEL